LVSQNPNHHLFISLHQETDSLRPSRRSRRHLLAVHNDPSPADPVRSPTPRSNPRGYVLKPHSHREDGRGGDPITACEGGGAGAGQVPVRLKDLAAGRAHSVVPDVRDLRGVFAHEMNKT
jgi:hypothetical protein